MNFKWTLSISLAVVFAFIVAYWIGKSYGKSLPPKLLNAPNDTQGKNGAASDEIIKGITDGFYDDIKGVKPLQRHNMTPYLEYLTLSNADKVRVINDWNQRYFNKWKEKLSTAIKGESFAFRHLTIIAAVLNSIENLETLSK